MHHNHIRELIFQTFLFFGCLLLFACGGPPANWHWETIEATGSPTARHEAAFVAYEDKLYLIGGRRINPTDVFDTKTNTWAEMSATPVELHHFQPVVVDDAIFLMGAMTGPWPNETPLDRVIIYHPEKDEFEYGDDIPEDRRRGGAGVVHHNGKIYMVGGITNGHIDGFVPWLDEYDPNTGEWRVLPDAPNARDHFQAVVLGNRLYAFGGRVSSRGTGEDMSRTISHGNVFDFETEQWLPVTNNMAIPTMRAGTATMVWNDEIIIGGGESMSQEEAHNQVEAYNGTTGKWANWPELAEGRHGTGFAIVGDYVYMASGSGGRGGGPELNTIERLELPKNNIESHQSTIDETPVYSQWHTVELTFAGPETSEASTDNPFLNYKFNILFKHADNQHNIKGFYAADGNAAETSAEAGNIWKVRFTPNLPGRWTYKATLYHGDSVALARELDPSLAVAVARLPDGQALAEDHGSFIVTPTDKDGPDFRAWGRLEANAGYFKFHNSDKYWIKGGADSPENFLAYEGFDDTYRMQASDRDGEASTNEQIHSYPSHLADWKQGDPTWKGEQGKSIIGAVNYLASKGMNVTYFLLNNINGDGKDVWPYVDPNDFTRFDVSKLEQWNIVFSHMQSKGIMLHVVLQETENETMLDHGDTGPLRQLYLNEMIARFGHHLGLTWNLGEENGPADFSPVAQNDRQRKEMISFLKNNDPYNHPVLLHTHSHDPARANILKQILGFQQLDGLSLQQDKRVNAPAVAMDWREKSIAAGHQWLISMDEIGMWHTGAKHDSDDPDHPTLRRYVLWGTLLSGAAGVEWYFGANNPQNDLNTEDWRTRDRLWELTRHALDFFEDHLPYWQMSPTQELISDKQGYCLSKTANVYAVYLPRAHKTRIDLTDVQGEFSVHWFDPLNGGALQSGTVASIKGGQRRSIGMPSGDPKQDWVVLIQKIEE